MKEGIQYTYERSLIERQTETERAMLLELEQGDYTIDSPLVKVNPYLINPLAAVVLFKTSQETAVTVRVHGIEPAGDIMHTFPPAKVHVLPVLGLYPGRKNRVDLSLYEGKTVQLEIETEVLSDDAPELCFMDYTSVYMQDQLLFLSNSLTALARAFD